MNQKKTKALRKLARSLLSPETPERALQMINHVNKPQGTIRNHPHSVRGKYRSLKKLLG